MRNRKSDASSPKIDALSCTQQTPPDGAECLPNATLENGKGTPLQFADLTFLLAYSRLEELA
jgi:hypothetical protein